MFRLSLFVLFLAFLFPPLLPMALPLAIYLWVMRYGMNQPAVRRVQEVLDALAWEALFAEAREHPEPLDQFPGEAPPGVAAYGVTPLELPNQYLRMRAWRQAVEQAAQIRGAFILHRPDGYYLAVPLTVEELGDLA